TLERRDRSEALRQRGDREEPRESPVCEDRCPRPRAGGHLRVQAGACGVSSRLQEPEEATMADAIIWELDGVDRSDYEAVNEKLGIDPDGESDWPDGLVHHTGAEKSGGFVVFEVWESRQAQERFLKERLGPALEAAGLTAPPARVEWF